MKHRVRWSSVAALVALAVGTPAAQDPPPLFRSSVDVVTIHASVRDKRNRPVHGLVPRDFLVFDDGEPRPLVTFSASDTAPVAVAFLMDVSGSMAVANKVGLAREVSNRMLAGMRAGDDEAALLTFDSQLTEQQPFTRELSLIGGALSAAAPFGVTSLYDAVAQTAEKIRATAARHGAIVVLTDGFDTHSTLTAGEVSAIASSLDVPVYVVATIAQADRLAIAERRDEAHYGADLRDLAAWSGGDVLVASSVTEAQAIGAALLRELRHQYVLGIAPGTAGGWKRLQVRVRQDHLQVRARSGYFGR